MHHHLRSLLLILTLSFTVTPLATRAETWFQEVKNIRREADAAEPRSKSFEIIPDGELTETCVKAGATFKNKGERVIVRRASIRVELPVAKEKDGVVYKYRTREVNYNGEPMWTGKWREPWTLGYFSYTVTATYKSNVYTKQFKVGREGVIGSGPK